MWVTKSERLLFVFWLRIADIKALAKGQKNGTELHNVKWVRFLFILNVVLVQTGTSVVH